jgi:hypothetical protein
MVSVRLFFMTDQLSGVHVSLEEMVTDKLNQSRSVRSVLELEIETLATVLFLDADTLGLGVMLHDQLLEVQKGSLMVHSLSNLNLGLPMMGCVCFFAVVTLIIIDNEFHNKSLLKGSSRFNFLLNRYLDFDSLGMRFRPDKCCVNELNFFQSLDFLQT